MSCHTNELGGGLSEALKNQVLADQATIPALTELLPAPVQALLHDRSFDHALVPTMALSLDAAPGSVQSAMCQTARGTAGLLRGAWSRWRTARGFSAFNGAGQSVVQLHRTPAGSLLLEQLVDAPFHHEDTFRLSLRSADFGDASAAHILASVLEGFLKNPPTVVARLMSLRNLLVRPLGLRTSPLGCPVSSLLSGQTCNLFGGRYPVLHQQIDADGRCAQVVLGATDKHLLFRSCVGVDIINGSRIDITLGTRVRCKNRFGRLYIALIDRVHRSYVTPTMLRLAVEHATYGSVSPMVPLTPSIGS